MDYELWTQHWLEQFIKTHLQIKGTCKIIEIYKNWEKLPDKQMGKQL